MHFKPYGHVQATYKHTYNNKRPMTSIFIPYRLNLDMCKYKYEFQWTLLAAHERSHTCSYSLAKATGAWANFLLLPDLH